VLSRRLQRSATPLDRVRALPLLAPRQRSPWGIEPLPPSRERVAQRIPAGGTGAPSDMASAPAKLTIDERNARQMEIESADF